jgi:multidrug resistance efflux pump
MRSKIIAIGLVLGTLVSASAFADEGKGAPSFPIPAAQFKQHVDARQAKARQHMEEKASKLSAADAQALRAKFDAATAKVNAEVAKAIADGTVTKEEAQAVRAASPHRGGGHCDGKGKDKKS